MRRSTVMLVGVYALCGVATGAHAQNTCQGAKIKDAGKKASCLAGLQAKVAASGGTVDPLKVAKCDAKVSAAYDKLEAKPGCHTTGDKGAIESKVDAFVNDLVSELAVGTLPNTCQGAKIKDAGKKAQCVTGLQAKVAAAGGTIDPLKLAKCQAKVSAAYDKLEAKPGCNTTGDKGAIEAKVDSFTDDLKSELDVGAQPTVLKFKTAPGTTSCGGAAFTPDASAPFSGNLFDDTACTTATAGGAAQLGRGCLYFGGGKASLIPPGLIPDGTTSTFSITGATTLGGNAGTGPKDCTNGSGPGKHCVNAWCNSDADCNGTAGSCVQASPPAPQGHCAPGTQGSPLTCSTDIDCGGTATACWSDANCYFGSPLPIPSPPPNEALTTCVLNVINTTASGTFDKTSGDSSITLPLGSRIYITGNSAFPCPTCVSGTCDASWVDVNSAAGEDNGKSCTTDGTVVQTTLDCRPPLAGYQAELAVNLNPLTTGAASLTNATGQFCPSQTVASAGAFGKGTARCIREAGAPAGDLSDRNPHASSIASVFCIPKTGNVSVDAVSNLPGPGAIAINGTTQIQ